MENQVTVTKSEELQLMQQQADAQFAMTSAGQMVKTFETTQRIGGMYAKSTIVPQAYQNNVANCAIAVDVAMHLGGGISPLTVMQNLAIVEGKPTWGAVFLISCINKCGKFSTIRYEEKSLGKIGRTSVRKYVYENGKNTQKSVETDEYKDIDNLSCIAYAYDLATGDKLCSSEITIKMAMSEGWYAKKGSKWQSMPQQMLKYRAAAFWQRAYAPEVGMGFYTTEEVQDMSPKDATYTEIKDADGKSVAEMAMEEAMKKAAQGSKSDEVKQPTAETEETAQNAPKEEAEAQATNSKEGRTLV